MAFLPYLNPSTQLSIRLRNSKMHASMSCSNVGDLFSRILGNHCPCMVRLQSIYSQGHIPQCSRCSVCTASSRSENTLEFSGSNRVPRYQSERVYGDRTALMRQKTSASPVSTSVGPILTIGPEQVCKQYLCASIFTPYFLPSGPSFSLFHTDHTYLSTASRYITWLFCDTIAFNIQAFENEPQNGPGMCRRRYQIHTIKPIFWRITNQLINYTTI